MRFLATAWRLGCQRRGFVREQARSVGLMGADEDADPPASRFALPRPVNPKHENSKTPATTLLSQSPEGMLRCHGSAYAQEVKQWRAFAPKFSTTAYSKRMADADHQAGCLVNDKSARVFTPWRF
jgi:hypothetical protein